MLPLEKLKTGGVATLSSAILLTMTHLMPDVLVKYPYMLICISTGDGHFSAILLHY